MKSMASFSSSTSQLRLYMNLQRKAAAHAQKLQAKLPQKSGSTSKPCAVPPDWPLPKDCAKEGPTVFEGHSCWKVVGHGVPQWVQFSKEIKTYLDYHSEPIPNDIVVWKLFIIGDTLDTAVYTIVICSRYPENRVAALENIRDNKILETYPGVHLYHSAMVPKSTKTLVMMSGRIRTAQFLRPSREFAEEYSEDDWLPRVQPLQLPIVFAEECLEDGYPPPSSSYFVSRYPNTSQSDQESAKENLYSSRLSGDKPVVRRKPTYPPHAFSNTRDLECGLALIVETSGEPEDVGKCTVGGKVLIDGQLYGMTAAHLFVGSQPSQESNDPATEPFSSSTSQRAKSSAKTGLTVEGTSDTVGTMTERSPSPSMDTAMLPPSHEPSALQTTSLNGVETTGNATTPGEQVYEMRYPVGQLWFSPIELSHPELDYALLKPRHRYNDSRSPGITVTRGFDYLELPAFLETDQLQTPINTEVTAKMASSSSMKGNFGPTPTFVRLPNTMRYQEMYAIKFKEQLGKGDCGAWVFDSASKSLLGHIVAGSPVDGLACIVPFYQVVTNLKKRF